MFVVFFTHVAMQITCNLPQSHAILPKITCDFRTNHMWFYLKLFLLYVRFTVLCTKSCLLCILSYTIIEERIFLLKQNHEFHSWNACFLRKITCGLHISHMWFTHESHVICMLNLITYFLQITCFFLFFVHFIKKMLSTLLFLTFKHNTNTIVRLSSRKWQFHKFNKQFL